MFTLPLNYGKNDNEERKRTPLPSKITEEQIVKIIDDKITEFTQKLTPQFSSKLAEII